MVFLLDIEKTILPNAYAFGSMVSNIKEAINQSFGLDKKRTKRLLRSFLGVFELNDTNKNARKLRVLFYLT